MLCFYVHFLTLSFQKLKYNRLTLGGHRQGANVSCNLNGRPCEQEVALCAKNDSGSILSSSEHVSGSVDSSARDITCEPDACSGQRAAGITTQCNNWRTDTRRQFTAHAASTTRKIAPRGVLISQECSVMDQFSPATIFGIFLGQYLLNRFTANNVFYLEFCYSLYRVDQKMRPQTHGHNSVKY